MSKKNYLGILDIQLFEYSKKVLVETIKGQEEVYLTKALIRKKDEKEYYFVYVGLKRDDLGFEGCEVLLNAYLF